MVFKPAKCPSCAGSLQLPDDRDQVICMYCGGIVIVREAIQLTLKVNTDNLMELAKASETATNYSEAYDYYTKVLESEPTNALAWEGKAKSAGWLSTITNIRTTEMLVGFNNAIKFTPDPEREAVQRRLAVEANNVCIAIYNLSRQHVGQFVQLDHTWKAYLRQCALIVSALEIAHAYDTRDQMILRNIIHICQDNIRGISFYRSDGSPAGVYLTDEYEADRRAKVKKYGSLLKMLDPTYEEQEVKKAKAQGMCYVVTATMGDEHPAVHTLRCLRDRYLVNWRSGRSFVRWYDARGPFFAEIIRNRKLLRLLSKILVVLPAAFVAGLVLWVCKVGMGRVGEDDLSVGSWLPCGRITKGAQKRAREEIKTRAD